MKRWGRRLWIAVAIVLGAIYLFLSVAQLASAQATEIRGRVSRFKDGDSFLIGSSEIRVVHQFEIVEFQQKQQREIELWINPLDIVGSS